MISLINFTALYTFSMLKSKPSLQPEEEQLVSEFVDGLKSQLGDHLKAVWLYGSRARNEGSPESDIDVIVIVDSDMKRWDEKVFNLGLGIEKKHDKFMLLKTLTYDLDWLEDRRKIEAFFVKEIDRDKVVLYGSEL